MTLVAKLIVPFFVVMADTKDYCFVSFIVGGRVLCSDNLCDDLLADSLL